MMLRTRLLTALFVLVLPAACRRPGVVARDAYGNGYGSSTTSNPTVTIDTGSLTGRSTTLPGSNKAVSRFLGIRFGEPPVRFAPPQPAQPWEGTHDASSYGSACFQQFNDPEENRNRSMSWFNSPPFQAAEGEDCLFLNIFAPASASPSSTKAVMVWIHGGSFKIGTGAQPSYDGTQFAGVQDVIIVTFNYRLGVFGFPGSPQIPEGKLNVGLLDQRLVLDWVQRNIAAFGGDPDRVTIFGESAGGGSVDVLVTSPPPGPLPFAAAIMESGQGTTMIDNPISNSRDSWTKMAREVGCLSASSSNTLECMRRKPGAQLKDVAQQKGLTFFPVHDGGATWGDHPRRDRLASTEAVPRIARVPILIGSNANEGGPFLYGQLDSKGFLEQYLPPDKPLGFVTTLLTTDPAGGPGLLDLSGRASRIITEYGFQCPAALVAADSRTVGIPAWRYFYNASFSNTEIYPGSGAYHSAEVKILFGTYPAADATPFQNTLSAAMQKAWADFAKNPTAGPGWAQAPAVALLGGAAASGQPDNGRQPVSTISPDVIDSRCPLYKVLYDPLAAYKKNRRV